MHDKKSVNTYLFILFRVEDIFVRKNFFYETSCRLVDIKVHLRARIEPLDESFFLYVFVKRMLVKLGAI